VINSLTDECLERLIDALAQCRTNAFTMVISNDTGCSIELSVSDLQTPCDDIFVLLKFGEQRASANLTTSQPEPLI